MPPACPPCSSAAISTTSASTSPTLPAFWELHNRLVAGGDSAGEVTDFGPVIGLDFTDPDGMACELNLILDPTLAGGHPHPSPFDLTSRGVTPAREEQR